MENCMVLLIAFPGTGKLTVAKSICDKTDFRLMDNHTSANLVFPICRVDGSQPIPQLGWDVLTQVRDVIMNNLPQLAPPNLSFIFTHVLFANDANDKKNYKRIETAAQKRGSTFVPVLLTCDPEENTKRIGMVGREEHMKMTCTNTLKEYYKKHTLYSEGHPNEYRLDITNIPPDQAADKIIAHFAKVSGP